MDLPESYNYMHIKNGVDKETIFRVKEIVDKDGASAWLEKFSFSTRTTWRKARTYPNSGKINVFKVDLRCMHSTDRRVAGLRSSKHTGCSATLQIVIKRFSESSTKENALNSEWPCIITIRGTHNHEVNNAESLKYRDMSSETFKKLTELFKKGYNASSALHALKTDLLLEYGDKYFKIAADGYYVPSYSKVHKMFENEFTSEYGPFVGDNFQNLQKQLEFYNANCEGTAKFFKTSDDSHYFVVICSPIMKRVHEMVPQTSELVLVDASGGMDKQRHRIYVFVTPTAAGGLPIGIIISDSEREYVFNEALTKLKDTFPEVAFYGKNEPQIFLTDNDLKERGPLKAHFPNSKLLLCQFHFLKALWSWLCDSKHKVDASHRQEIYTAVKDVLYAKTVDTATVLHQRVLSLEVSKKYNSFLLHYLNLWERNKEWASYHRQDVLLRGTNTTNYVEVVFRILKDCIFDRAMAFNLTQFVDYVLIRYESYIEKRLVDFSNGRCPKAVIKSFLPSFNPKNYSFLKDENGIFIVKNISTSVEYYVDILKGICSCTVGLSGKICTHVSFIVSNIGDDIETSFNLATQKTKEIMLYIATGKKAPSNWFKPLQSNCLAVNENIESHELENTNQNSKNGIEGNEFNINEQISSQTSSANISENTAVNLSLGEKQELTELFKKMMDGIENVPELYVPAARKMLQNAKKYASTEVGLISAMHTFGTYNGALTNTCAKKLIKRSHSVRIGVQPTAVGRRKNCLTGKRKISAGRERGQTKVLSELKCHDYTAFGSLPKRKKKAPHNLSDCVYSNKGLSNKK